MISVRLSRIALALLGSAALIPGGSAGARTWRITPDGSGDAPTVQAGIDSARSGDVVLLSAGTYTWTAQASAGTSMLRLAPGLTLRGEAGAAATILDAEAQGRILECADAGALVVVEELTFQNGRAPRERPPAAARDGARVAAPNDSHGGAIDVRGASEPTIRRCVFSNNVATGGAASGGAVRCDRALIEDCMFVDNVAGVSGFTNGSGGAVRCADAMLERCLFRGNRAWGYEAASGGAVCATSATFRDCTFEDNQAECPGGPAGGAVADRGHPVITACVFRANRVSAHYFFASGGAVLAGSGSVAECLFLDNTATCNQGPGRGGALAGSELAVVRCAFVGNEAARLVPPGAGVGGAVYALFPSSLESCTLVANSGGAADGIGAIDFEEGGSVHATLVTGTTLGAVASGNETWSCCVLFGNAAGDKPPGTDAGVNFSADPYYCTDPRAAGDVSLRSDSACAAGNHPWAPRCPLIGSGVIACEAQAVAPRSWSAVKQLYRP